MTYPNQPPQWNQNQYGQPYGQQPQYGQQPPQYGQPTQYGYGPYGPQGQWGAPQTPSRPNIFAGVLLDLGGLFGVLQFFLPWIDSSFSNVHVNGMDIAELAGQASALGASASESTLIQIGVWTVLVGGALALLLGAVMFVPMRSHRPLGAIALVLSVLMVLGAVFWLTGGEANPDSTSVGYYFFLFSGVIALIGSIVGVVRR
ncbi:hypothetical protein FHX82_003515 [Amycolatopsis bartoniae]|uniref:Uncharacterized protein n=1 Tax=Amycolatopsis bartoniae TaxID=941986 RepID=A0A8H9MF72_9PSEU|nr:hypothetical protein [Amycolatopsis bartoniae]MBB2936451.1 hypothetical protein [Amycolatopsis bartoniae]GHF68848.1 hypothetical protein GCM10017566_48380 [Amycolatopsis bartoniae]